MGSASLGDAVSRVSGDGDYQAQFHEVFGRGVNEQDMLSAIAAYERTLMSFDSPFDHFIAGDGNAISDSAKRGWALFNSKARRQLCHSLTDSQTDVTVFTDNDFHNIGIGIIRHRIVPLAQQAERDLAQGQLQEIDKAAVGSELSVLGRFLVTKREADIASFKTPGLRNVLVTLPISMTGRSKRCGMSWTALSRCRAESAKCRCLRNCQAAATAVRHVVIAAARSTRCVWAEVRVGR